ncbi:hypothetical protein CGRA01v4_06504 [Colletotrichum graminicola]|nr:hypothetical protein CGRA01v4_06504 [Colletotrichum graminicola]
MLSCRLSGRGTPLWGVSNSTGNETHNAIPSPMPNVPPPALFFFSLLSFQGFLSFHNGIQRTMQSQAFRFAALCRTTFHPSPVGHHTAQ